MEERKRLIKERKRLIKEIIELMGIETEGGLTLMKGMGDWNLYYKGKNIYKMSIEELKKLKEETRSEVQV